MSRAFAMYASVRHYLCELDPRVGDWNIGAGLGDVGDGWQLTLRHPPQLRNLG